MKDINISVRFKKCGVTTICYVLIERKNVPVINEVNSILTTKLFMSSALTVAVELEQRFNLEVFCNKDTEFDVISLIGNRIKQMVEALLSKTK